MQNWNSSCGRALSLNPAKRARPKIRAAVEAMEMRLVLSTFVVNTFVDQSDPPTSTTVSLRDAIARAATHAGADTINVPAGAYPLMQGELFISDGSGAVTINAIGGMATIDAGGASRVVEVAAKATASINGFTLTGGNNADSGGGILNGGTLSLMNVTVTDNSSPSYLGNQTTGGGIMNVGSLTISSSTITGNSSYGSGGGISNQGTLKISDSTISGNTTESGGGIYNSGAAIVSGVTLSSNYTSSEDGGGITNTGKLTLINSTISGNTVITGYCFYNTGAATVDDSTIDNNELGILTTGSLSIADSIVANNNFENIAGGGKPDVTGSVTSHGGNFIGQIDTSTGWLASDQVGTVSAPLDPKLAPLANYGGVTQTLVPFAGSPVLGQGVAGAVPAGVGVDQRGLPRIVNGKVDVGAVELEPTLIHVKSPAPISIHPGNVADVKLGSFSAPTGSGPFLVDVSWGDGTPDTVFSQDGAGAVISQSHPFGRTGHLTGGIAIIDARGDGSNLAPFTVSVTVSPLVNIVVNTTKDQSDLPGSKTVSLRDALALIGGPVNITFDPKVFARNQVITLQAYGLELSNTFGLVNIIGPAAGVTIVGTGVDTTITVDSHVTADFSGLTITNGYSSGYNSDGGVINHGNLTIAGSTIANNTGGIQNDGDLTLRDSTVSGNMIVHTGGGLFNSGAATVANCTFSGNFDYVSGDFPDNTVGGAIYNTGQLTLTNSTLTGNSSGAAGAGLYNLGTAAVSDCTISDNIANSTYGGGIANVAPGKLTIANSILSGNTAYAGANDVYGAIKSLGHNLVGQTDGSTGWIASDLKGRVFKPIDAKLSPLGNYGGSTETQFPLAGSPAIGGGSVALIPNGAVTDQRGFARIIGGKVDIGAVELQKAAVVTVAPPAMQHVVAGVATAINLGSFADPGGKAPFAVDVDWGDGSPIGVYSAKNAGKLGSHTHTFINTGSLTGSIIVFDGAGDVSQFTPFSISSAIAPAITIVVNTTNDQIDPAASKTVSLRDAMDRADAGFGPVKITFDSKVFAIAKTIQLDGNIDGSLDLFKNRFGAINLMGPTAGVTINGAIQMGVGITASIDHLNINYGGINNEGTLSVSHGEITNANTPFGGVSNGGAMTLTACTITGNTAEELEGQKGGYYDGDGGGVYNDGTITIVGCTISGNAAVAGGGVFNTSFNDSSSMTIIDSTISGNTSTGGGGIFNYGNLNVAGCTISGNHVSYGRYEQPGQGGGIFNAAALTLTNSTIAGNSADNAGGVYNSDRGKTTIAECTISGNISTTGGGGIDNSGGGVVTIFNTIVAANHGSAATPDVVAKFKSLGHNLIGVTNGSTGWIASDLTGSIGHPLDAKLSSLGNHGGPTQTMIPLAGSPALQAGSASLIPPGVTTDQRGSPSVVNGKVDIGAVEISGA